MTNSNVFKLLVFYVYHIGNSFIIFYWSFKSKFYQNLIPEEKLETKELCKTVEKNKKYIIMFAIKEIV